MNDNSKVIAGGFLAAFLGLLVQFAAEELKSVIPFGVQLFIVGYVLMAGGALTAFVGIMTHCPEEKRR